MCMSVLRGLFFWGGVAYIDQSIGYAMNSKRNSKLCQASSDHQLRSDHQIRSDHVRSHLAATSSASELSKYSRSAAAAAALKAGTAAPLVAPAPKCLLLGRGVGSLGWVSRGAACASALSTRKSVC